MTFRLACGDVMPGCTAVFEEEDRDALMSRVGAHAADHHDLHDLTPEVVQAVGAKVTRIA